jgi:hypothetical protein
MIWMWLPVVVEMVENDDDDDGGSCNKCPSRGVWEQCRLWQLHGCTVAFTFRSAAALLLRHSWHIQHSGPGRHGTARASAARPKDRDAVMRFVPDDAAFACGRNDSAMPLQQHRRNSLFVRYK